MRTEVSFLALVPSTFTAVPPSQSSAHVPLHSEAGEPVTQPRPRRRDSGLRSLQGLGSGGRPRAEGVVCVGFPPFPPRVLPLRQGPCDHAEIFGPQDARQEASSPLTSCQCQFSFLGWVGKGPRRGPPIPPHLAAEARRAGGAQKAVSTPFGPSAPSQLRERPLLPPWPGLPGGASARHLHGGAPGI